MSYSDQLHSVQWKIKREWVIYRDNHKCVMCGCNHHLRVHHKIYIFGRKAWEYDLKDLITVCNYCHRLIHNQLIFDRKVKRDFLTIGEILYKNGEGPSISILPK